MNDITVLVNTSSATAERQRVSYTRHSWLLHWRALHRTLHLWYNYRQSRIDTIS